MFDEYFSNVSNESFLDFSETAQNAIRKIVENPELICQMLWHILEDPILMEKSECYDFLDKMVVYSNDETGVYARVSLFHEGYGERIHYHRWNYASYILNGGYTQKIFGNVCSGREMSSIEKEDVLLCEKLRRGNIYSLESSMIHSIQVKPQTVSFCIRGKALCNRFQVKDISNGTVWWQYGNSFETLEEKRMKQISSMVLQDKVEEIIKLIARNGNSYV